MTTLASATLRRPPLGRAALLALTLALLLGGWLLLATPAVDAQNMNYFGRWYAKIGSAAICPDQNDVEADAATYSRTSANTITLIFKEWEVENCGPDTVMTSELGALYRNRWYIELRDASGSGGSLISGAHIDLPAGFSGRRTSGTLNRRDHTTDGDWPYHSSHWSWAVHPVEISFSIPAGHTGPAYLHAGIYFNEQGENYDVWEDFSFKFDSPEAAANSSDPSDDDSASDSGSGSGSGSTPSDDDPASGSGSGSGSTPSDDDPASGSGSGSGSAPSDDDPASGSGSGSGSTPSDDDPASGSGSGSGSTPSDDDPASGSGSGSGSTPSDDDPASGSGSGSGSTPSGGTAAGSSSSPSPRPCVGPIYRSVHRYGPEFESQDSRGRFALIQVTVTHDCNGTAYTSRTQYGALINEIPADIARPRTPHCSEIRRGLSWDYDRNSDGSLATSQGDLGTRYQFRVRWTGDDCTRPTQYRGSVGGGTYCGGGVLSQTPTILRRAIAADNNRIVYDVQLVQRLRGSGFGCPLEISNRFWTYDLPATITAP